MDVGERLIILKGKPRSLEVESIERRDSTHYVVTFKNKPEEYSYNSNNVVIISPDMHLRGDDCKVFVKSKRKKSVSELWRYKYQGSEYWRISYENGFIGEYSPGQVRVILNCLTNEQARDVLRYLKDVADINPLGKSETESGILKAIYDKLGFIDDQSCAACYLDPKKHKVKPLNGFDLIFPFGCNASQKQAVKQAFSHQISIIQGPPGTGKTHTILNIIANIVCHGKSVMVVSNNNSATANVLEKLQKNDFGFIVAPLGKNDNKEAFIANQPPVPTNLRKFILAGSEVYRKMRGITSVSSQLDEAFEIQNRLAESRQELSALEIEWKHFCLDNPTVDSGDSFKIAPSSNMISLWYKLQAFAENNQTQNGLIQKLKLFWWRLLCKYRWKLKNKFDLNNLWPLIQELQSLYYRNRLTEIRTEISQLEERLSQIDFQTLLKQLTNQSLSVFRAKLYDQFHQGRPCYADIKELQARGDEFLKDYPVVLSTTFSARSCLTGNELYDYVIMDEASQISTETGLLALSCAKNAVIVGDTLQLPNVVTEVDKVKLKNIADRYKIAPGYDAAGNSLLKSVIEIIPEAPQTLLREHYRCHPRIINFCNQRYYGGNLRIMTLDNGEPDVLSVIKTPAGNHAVDRFNQREIDVVKLELLPKMRGHDSIGIITPYNNQVNHFNAELPDIECATVHKYQGRERDTIIMSVVDNQISEFADDPNMLNVAVSRAKNQFCMVVSGNEQERQGNIASLLDYIAYNNFSVSESAVRSIFDYLYVQYTEKRISMLESVPGISEYDSELITYKMLQEVVGSSPKYAHLETICHSPLRSVVGTTAQLDSDERRYANHHSTHLDFLLVDRVTHKPIMAIETDGYSYHNEKTEQHQRDILKDNILRKCGLPLLRLSTKGSNESARVCEMLNVILN